VCRYNGALVIKPKRLRAASPSPQEADQLMEQGRKSAEAVEKELDKCTKIGSRGWGYRVR
jgi:hypothetical protein